jgi:hypothetical protein
MEVEAAPVVMPEVLRADTPPPFEMEEQTTPRSDAGKRRAKYDAALPRFWKPTEQEVRNHIKEIGLCVVCWQKGHWYTECPHLKEEDRNRERSLLKDIFYADGEFNRHRVDWQTQRRRRGKPYMLETAVAKQVVIPPYCLRCKCEGHNMDDKECPNK